MVALAAFKCCGILDHGFTRLARGAPGIGILSGIARIASAANVENRVWPLFVAWAACMHKPPVVGTLRELGGLCDRITVQPASSAFSRADIGGPGGGADLLPSLCAPRFDSRDPAALLAADNPAQRNGCRPVHVTPRGGEDTGVRRQKRRLPAGISRRLEADTRPRRCVAIDAESRRDCNDYLQRPESPAASALDDQARQDRKRVR